MTEVPKNLQNKEQKASERSIEAEKENAKARAQLDAYLHSSKKGSVENIRVTTDDVETQVSQLRKTTNHDAEAGNSIDV